MSVTWHEWPLPEAPQTHCTCDSASVFGHCNSKTFSCCQFFSWPHIHLPNPTWRCELQFKKVGSKWEKDTPWWQCVSEKSTHTHLLISQQSRRMRGDQRVGQHKLSTVMIPSLGRYTHFSIHRHFHTCGFGEILQQRSTDSPNPRRFTPQSPWTLDHPSQYTSLSLIPSPILTWDETLILVHP